MPRCAPDWGGSQAGYRPRLKALDEESRTGSRVLFAIEQVFPVEAARLWDVVRVVLAEKKQKPERDQRKLLPVDAVNAWYRHVDLQKRVRAKWADPAMGLVVLTVGSEEMTLKIQPYGPASSILKGSGAGRGNRAAATVAFGALGALASSGATRKTLHSSPIRRSRGDITSRGGSYSPSMRRDRSRPHRPSASLQPTPRMEPVRSTIGAAARPLKRRHRRHPVSKDPGCDGPAPVRVRRGE